MIVTSNILVVCYKCNCIILLSTMTVFLLQRAILDPCWNGSADSTRTIKNVDK